MIAALALVWTAELLARKVRPRPRGLLPRPSGVRLAFVGSPSNLSIVWLSVRTYGTKWEKFGLHRNAEGGNDESRSGKTRSRR
jgi:hypothetical protein